jgi:site-specific DNA-methyltransferase (adenine-specific)
VEFVSDADRKESTAKNQHADFGTAPITNNIVYGDYSMMKPKNYNPPGRWPANFIHDGSDEVVGLFPMTGKGNGGEPYNYAGKEYNNKDSSMFNGDKPQAPSNFNDNGSAARFFYCPKVSKSERNAGCDNKHPTVKPTDLMRYLCKLITPPGGIVLDPFMGSGSTGCAALLDGFKFIGMELDDEYFKIAEARITHINPSDFW